MSSTPPVLPGHDPKEMIGRAVVLKPGDIFVVEMERELSMVQFERFREQLLSVSKELGLKVLVLPAGAKIARVDVEVK